MNGFNASIYGVNLFKGSPSRKIKVILEWTLTLNSIKSPIFQKLMFFLSMLTKSTRANLQFCSATQLSLIVLKSLLSIFLWGVLFWNLIPTVNYIWFLLIFDSCKDVTKTCRIGQKYCGSSFPKKHLIVCISGFFNLPDFRTSTPSPVVSQNNAKSANTTK